MGERADERAGQMSRRSGDFRLQILRLQILRFSGFETLGFDRNVRLRTSDFELDVGWGVSACSFEGLLIDHLCLRPREWSERRAARLGTKNRGPGSITGPWLFH